MMVWSQTSQRHSLLSLIFILNVLKALLLESSKKKEKKMKENNEN